MRLDAQQHGVHRQRGWRCAWSIEEMHPLSRQGDLEVGMTGEAKT